MELLREIYERDLGISDRDDNSRRHGKRVWLRRLVRGVIYNDRQEIALLHMTDGDYYELPGCELEGAVSMAEALQRRAFSALGVSIKVIGEIGLVMEYRDEHELLQFAYGYVAELASEMPVLEESERLPLRWLMLQDAIALLGSHRADSYTGKFNQQRDLCYLKLIQQEGADE